MHVMQCIFAPHGKQNEEGHDVWQRCIRAPHQWKDRGWTGAEEQEKQERKCDLTIEMSSLVTHILSSSWW